MLVRYFLDSPKKDTTVLDYDKGGKFKEAVLCRGKSI
jgi:hypothetical protein